MALAHATTDELIDLLPIGIKLSEAVSTALIKTPHIEVMRWILRAGKTMPEHKVAGEITVQCLEGAVELQIHGRAQTLRTGHWVYLVGGEPYALRAIKDSALLVTILLNQG